ncbi:TetR family transcriptional regulator protein [Hyella patelloides LEGE 07179]|uniref:TetR family transcriptional regulator protein n=1 Tax=Hyella patelloides LEGE 07179 TaxID=945734 RepID=A0A563VV39_9CYAN|nr:TetR/AcrR family transcriptional regulator [Hyella patelloides]VEP15141.1 TetR family transcriptional regulator protein [Hyella patelloides LEGE 07179]
MKPQNNLLRRQPQQKRSQERVENILDAAAIVFDEVGFEAATTHAIAARANTAVGSLYQFFPDKLAIFNALELRHVERVYVVWDKLLRPEVIQLPFAEFIHTMTTQFQKLFEQPTSRIIFVQFFTSPTIFKNIDHSFTQEAIQFTAKLLQSRNPALEDKRSLLLAEICVHGINTLILLALRSDQAHSQEIFIEIEILLKAYLKDNIGDEVINNNSFPPLEKIAKQYKLNSRQSLILKYASNNSEITIKNCEAMFPDISRRTIQRDLKTMIEQKLLLPQGNTDRRCYSINQELLNL